MAETGRWGARTGIDRCRAAIPAYFSRPRQAQCASAYRSEPAERPGERRRRRRRRYRRRPARPCRAFPAAERRLPVSCRKPTAHCALATSCPAAPCGRAGIVPMRREHRPAGHGPARKREVVCHGARAYKPHNRIAVSRTGRSGRCIGSCRHRHCGSAPRQGADATGCRGHRARRAPCPRGRRLCCRRQSRIPAPRVLEDGRKAGRVARREHPV